MVLSVGFHIVRWSVLYVHFRMHDVSQLEEGSLPVVRVVEMWSQHVLNGPYVDKDVDTLRVFDSFYHSNVTRDYLNQHKVKYIRALHPNRFKVQCDLLRRKVRKVGECAGIYNKVTGEIIMQYYAKAQHGQKEAKIRTAMSNAYQRFARPGTHQHRPAIDAYKKKFGVCDLFNYLIAKSNTVSGLTSMVVRVPEVNGVSRIRVHSVVFYSTLSMLIVILMR